MTQEEQKKSVSSQLWLDYFNRVLLQAGVISDREWGQMSRKIAAHSRAAVKETRRDGCDGQ